MANVNLLLIGEPGTGKTAIIEELYQDAFTKVLVSAMVEEDVAGLPYRNGDKEMRTCPQFLDELLALSKTKKKTCLLLDELDKARQEVADTLLTLIQSRKIGKWELPINCDIIATANPTHSGGGNGISEPMQNRFSIVNWKMSEEKWSNWCEKKYPKFKHIAKAVRSGELPLYDMAGEGFEMRITNPRTLEMAMNSVDCPIANKIEKIKGLLTPLACSFFIDYDNIFKVKVNKFNRQYTATANTHIRL
jgi:GTPase SAR1 family protein